MPLIDEDVIDTKFDKHGCNRYADVQNVRNRRRRLANDFRLARATRPLVAVEAFGRCLSGVQKRRNPLEDVSSRSPADSKSILGLAVVPAFSGNDKLTGMCDELHKHRTWLCNFAATTLEDLVAGEVLRTLEPGHSRKNGGCLGGFSSICNAISTTDANFAENAKNLTNLVRLMNSHKNSAHKDETHDTWHFTFLGPYVA